MGKTAEQMYREKLTTPEQAVKVVKSGDHLFYSEFVMFPTILDDALSKRVDEIKDVEIRGVCFSRPSLVIAADPEANHVRQNDYYFGPVSRRLYDEGMCDHIPTAYYQAPHTVSQYIDVDVAFVKVGPMSAAGYFNLGTSNSITPTALAKAKTIILEVNQSVPHCLGGNQEILHISQATYVVDGGDAPLQEVPTAKPSAVDQKIAGYVMKEITDGTCIQLGIGGLPNAVGAMIADSDLKDLGFHSEMLCDAVVDMVENGNITGLKKNIDKGKLIYTFAMGTKRLYDFIDNNPSCAIFPVDYTNNPNIMAQNDKFMAINNAIEVDLYGQVCSESAGFNQKSGTGGQLDFIFGAYNSKGGKGLICLNSTFKDKNGERHSRIVPALAPGSIITVPRSITQYVVTEFGCVQLKGESIWKRAEMLIDIAHPDFQDQLVKQAEKQGIWCRCNKFDALAG